MALVKHLPQDNSLTVEPLAFSSQYTTYLIQCLAEKSLKKHCKNKETTYLILLYFYIYLFYVPIKYFGVL